MSSTTHVIKRAVVELILPSADHAFTIQNEAAITFRGRILPMLEEILDDLELTAEVIQLDKLKIDIHLPGADLNEQFALDQIRAKLEDELGRLLNEARRGEQSDFGNVIRRDSRQTEEELFFYLLRHGRAPWWAASGKRFSIEDLFQKVIKNHSEHFKHNFFSGIERIPFVKRLVHSLTPAQLLDLVKEVIPQAAHSLSLLYQFSQSVVSDQPASERLFQLFFVALSRNDSSASNIIADYIRDKGNIELALKIYQKVDDIAVVQSAELSEIVKGALARNDSFYKGKIRESFSPGDKKKYFGEERATELQSNRIIPNKSTGHETGEINEFFNSPGFDEDDTYHVYNAGIVILAPFLSTFFKELDLTDGDKFKSSAHAERAAFLLQYLATGNENSCQEHEMILNKILCGIEISEPLTLNFELSEKETGEALNLLNSVASHWNALRGTSGDSMRKTFFGREGSLEPQSNGWNLRIEKQSFDVLIEKLPWGISLIKLPWMNGAVFVDW